MRDELDDYALCFTGALIIEVHPYWIEIRRSIEFPWACIETL
jgi:hypothetical protein